MAVGFVAASLGVAIPVAHADPLQVAVTTFDDVVDGGDGLTSLREAIALVRANGGQGNVIALETGTYELDSTLTIEPDTDTGMTLLGAGMADTVIDGNGHGRTVLVDGASLSVAFRDLTIRGAQSTLNGAGLRSSAADLDLERVRVTDNTLTTSEGSAAGLSASGGAGSTFRLVDSVIDDNTLAQEPGDGGASAAMSVAGFGATEIVRTRISNNRITGPDSGSSSVGIALLQPGGGGSLLVHDVTVDGNTVSDTGAESTLAIGASPDASADLRNLTVVDNAVHGAAVSVQLTADGFAIEVAHATVEHAGPVFDATSAESLHVADSLLWGDEATCPMTVATSGGGNVMRSDACPGTADDDTATAEGPLLSDLEPSPALDTWARPLPGSPVLEAAGAPSADVDARGVARPQGAAADAGAVEIAAPLPVDDDATTTFPEMITVDVLANDGAGEPGLLIEARVISSTGGTASLAGHGLVEFEPERAGTGIVDLSICLVDTPVCVPSQLTIDVAEAPDSRPGESGVVRRAGLDRFETAVLASAAEFDPGVGLAVIATGADFPDALAGAPMAAANHAPILLTRRDTLPDATAAELDRLDPARIVVLGGNAAVADTLLPTLQAHTDGNVTRIFGANRYETAAAIAALFPAGSPAYLATGSNFPDALAGAAAAGRDTAPILLTTTHTLPNTSAAALQRLQPPSVTALGGDSVIAPAVLDAVTATTGIQPTRLAGTDRFDTSAVVAATFDHAETIYLATGLAFPDALAAGPLAGAEPAPILLTRPDALPQTVIDQITRLAPHRIVVLGGNTAVATTLDHQLAELLDR